MNKPTSGITIEKCAINSASELAKFIRQLMVLGDNVLPECRRPATDGISNSMMNRVVNANNDYYQSYWKFVDNLVSDQEFNERIEKLSRERYNGRSKTENTR